MAIIELTDKELEMIHECIENTEYNPCSLELLKKLKCTAEIIYDYFLTKDKINELLNNPKIKELLPQCCCEMVFNLNIGKQMLWTCSIHGPMNMSKYDYIKQMKDEEFEVKIRRQQTRFLKTINLCEYV